MFQVSHISLHNEKANSTECQYSSFKFALAHLSKPVQFNETIQPICVDGFNTKAELTDTNSYDPGRFYRLEWSRDSRKKVLEYFVRRINISSQESCISKSKNDLTTPFLEALECVDTSGRKNSQDFSNFDTDNDFSFNLSNFNRQLFHSADWCGLEQLDSRFQFSVLLLQAKYLLSPRNYGQIPHLLCHKVFCRT